VNGASKKGLLLLLYAKCVLVLFKIASVGVTDVSEEDIDISDVDTSSNLGKLTVEGRKLCKILHEYQSVIPKLIQVKGDDVDKDKLYNKNLELLDPQVQKMRDLFKFHEKMSTELISWFKSNVEKTSFSDKDLLEIVNALDAALTVDTLKTFQAGLNNDFSMYRRAVQIVKKDYNMSDDEPLRFFLISTGNIIKQLKTDIHKCTGYYKPLTHVVKYASTDFEKNNKNYKDIRVITLAVFLLDDDLINNKVIGYVKKHVKILKTQKMLEDNPKIEIYKGVPFNVESYIKKMFKFHSS